MKEIRLLRLKLNHFQGGIFELNTDGKSAFCYGENSSGKTRLFSAFTYLLYGKDSLGRSDFSLKDLNERGEIRERGINHEVEAVLSMDGKQITLKKVFKEKFVKTRGRAEAEFGGHVTQHYVNSIPKSEKEYKEFISEMAGAEETFRLLTSPSVFASLPWQRQRSILLDVVGDLTPEDVITSDPNLSSLTQLLEKFKMSKTPFEDLRKTITIRRTEINKELPQISVRIDEVRRGIPDITGIDRKAAEKEAQEFETALNDAKLRLQGVNTGGPIGNLSQRLSGLNADLRKMEDAHRSESLSTLNRLNQQVSELFEKVQSSQRRLVTIHADLKRKDNQIQIMNADLGKLRDRWTVIDAEIFRDTTADICPACGQVLPGERVKEAREKALASFNENKADQLGGIDRKGHDLKEQRDQLKEQEKDLFKERTELEMTLTDVEHSFQKTSEDRNTLKANSEDFSGIQGRADLLDEIEDLEAQIKGERNGKKEEAQNIQIDIDHLSLNVSSAKQILNRFLNREQGEKRIEELKKEEKILAAEFERLESELFLMDAFIKTKVSMLTDRINSKFEMVRFKLFHQNINGGIEEVCIITVNGVPIDGGLNNGARINAGLEIVKVLQEYYQLKAPVFADNAEAVNALFNVGSQMIRLYVSEDKTLRVEIGEAAKTGNTEVRSRSSVRRVTLS